MDSPRHACFCKAPAGSVLFCVWQPLGPYAERVVRIAFPTSAARLAYMFAHPESYAACCPLSGHFPHVRCTHG